uniref:Uncharacterized protein n=1 Tax=Geospiza parvula TaxID=87175 RepID=A0A8C3M8R3_GEOPR
LWLRLRGSPGSPGFPGRSPRSQRLTHAAGQVRQDIVAPQAAQHIEELPHGGPAGAASRPFLQQRGRGVGQPLEPPDLQEAAAQRLRQRRPVRGRGGPRVEVEAEAAAHAVVQSYHGHGVRVQRRDGADNGAGADSGVRWGRSHGRAALPTSPSRHFRFPARPASPPPPRSSLCPPFLTVRGSLCPPSPHGAGLYLCPPSPHGAELYLCPPSLTVRGRTGRHRDGGGGGAGH